MTKITESLDVRGEVCPYPDVKTKRKIKKMSSGEILEIKLDYPLSAERIPETMKSLGHEVLSVKYVDFIGILIDVKLLDYSEIIDLVIANDNLINL